MKTCAEHKINIYIHTLLNAIPHQFPGAYTKNKYMFIHNVNFAHNILGSHHMFLYKYLCMLSVSFPLSLYTIFILIQVLYMLAQNTLLLKRH